MIASAQVPEPFLFNPLKHHLGFMKEFIEAKTDVTNFDIARLTSDLKCLGRSIMDVYTGNLSIKSICQEINIFLGNRDRLNKESFRLWAGPDCISCRIIPLSDDSMWALKYHNSPVRYIHIFPARRSKFTFRVKSNAIKSALLYYIIIGKDMITATELNKVRQLIRLSAVKDPLETEAIVEMIEILRH